jgi:hypothetical protein
MVRKMLKAKARDNHGNSYDVSLDLAEFESGKTRDSETGEMRYARADKWVLKIHKTPGQWYLSSLCAGLSRGRSPGVTMSLDYGQNWICTNFTTLLEEALELI